MSKYSAELKIAACKDFLSGALSFIEVCEKYGIHYDKKKGATELRKWIAQYEKQGTSAFIQSKRNNRYTAFFKETVVLDYLSGKGSFFNLSIKYKIPDPSTVRRWVSVYNANRELKDFCPEREVYMAGTGRKTTTEERIEIAEYCIEHERNYKETAVIYEVSYSQVYSWVKKYDAAGKAGLTDKRGHHKTDEEVDELERLRRENARLKRQLQEKDMLAELLKKLQEFERM